MGDRKEAEAFVTEKYAEGTMWGEAQAQRMESWLECDDDELDWEDILSDTRGDTLYWLEEMMGDANQEDLLEGNIYHWMVLAYEEGS